jgi:NAD-dependent SIR2 family protein deacetylase
MTTRDAIAAAASAVSGAGALLISAGAGMGVDSGLPAVRGPGGFADAYPRWADAGLRYEDLVRPAAFDGDPHLAWGFHGTCRRLYRSTRPHAGFAVLRRWAAGRPGGAFVYTSNVDGQFQAVGFDARRVMECHGSALRLQCTGPCSPHVWDAGADPVRVDEATGRALDPLPACPRCGRLARPNVRMFDDACWVGRETAAQSGRFEAWKADVAGGAVTVLEIGAGTVVPAVRVANEWSVRQLGATLVRINPTEADVPAGHVAVPCGALTALTVIDRAMRGDGEPSGSA